MHSAQHAILHMDLDSFFVSCERILDSRLKDRPVLIGGVSDRGVVASCSYEARQFGIRSAMPMRLARQLCPEAVVIRGNSGTYMKFSEDVTEIIKEYVPVYEKASIDEFYVDLSGMDRYFGCYQYATELRTRIIKETHLPISFGLSINKTVSKIATGEAKPNNRIQVEAGGEKPFLAPLSVRKIPMVGDSTFQMLCHMGLQRIGTIQEIPIELMEKAFGKNGITLWKKASGIDNTPVIPYNERKSISTERTFDRDTIEVTKLRSILTA
ncbi:MAG: DNA polymerase IV, partial [Bacteroidota bacterium]